MKLLVFDGTAGEIADLMERMPHLNSVADPLPLQSAPSAMAGTSPTFSAWTREKMERMYNQLYGDQRKLVDFILTSPDAKVTVREAQKYLGFGPGPRIAGVLSSITRNARRITKYREARLVDEWFDEAKKAWGYCLREPTLSLLRQLGAPAKRKAS